MILDTLANAACYEVLHPAFAEAFRQVAELASQTNLSPGRVELDGDALYAVVVDGEGRARSDAKLETHRNHIDIQFTAAGCDCIGWTALEAVGPGDGYDADADAELFGSVPVTWFDVPAGHFAIFFPEDAHAPMANTGQPTRKIVVKVAV